MNISRHSIKARSGFTLVELLVVIAIIAILAGILLPTVNRAILRAEEGAALTGVKSLVTAIQQYYNTYGKLPVPATDHNQADTFYDENDSKDIIKILIAEDDTLNPRKITFLEVDDGLADGTMLDPWGTQYTIKMDNDYDDKVEYYSSPDEFNTVAIAVSFGVDGVQGDPADEDDIVSHKKK